MTAAVAKLTRGQTVQVHVHGHDHTGEVIAASRSRATVRYIDPWGDERITKLPIGEVVLL